MLTHSGACAARQSRRMVLPSLRVASALLLVQGREGQWPGLPEQSRASKAQLEIQHTVKTQMHIEMEIQNPGIMELVKYPGAWVYDTDF